MYDGLLRPHRSAYLRAAYADNIGSAQVEFEVQFQVQFQVEFVAS
jgi:hypothetical protein